MSIPPVNNSPDDFMKAIWQVISISALIHATLIIYSLWHDKNFQFKYTDLDYWVFGDAARAVAAGFSPFARATYRYSPLLAYLLLPGKWLGFEAAYGKMLFSSVDLMVGYLIYRLLRLKGWHSVDAARHSALFWLLNPMALAISTRGNAESLVCACVLGVVYLLMVRKRLEAALLFGFSVHFKIFPIIYAPSILMFLGIYHKFSNSPNKSKSNGSDTNSPQMVSLQSFYNSNSTSVMPLNSGIKLSSSPLIRSASPNRLTESMSSGIGGLNGLISQRRPIHSSVSRSTLLKQSCEDSKSATITATTVIKSSNGTKITVYPPSKVLFSLFSGRITIKSSHLAFSVISASVFLLLTGLFYLIHGKLFLDEALLYHLIRKDHRHNFSPYYLQFYLESVLPLPKWIPIAAFIPQVILLTLVALKYARKDLPFACFLQTFIFVTFNKVCTSQVRIKKCSDVRHPHYLVLFVVFMLLTGGNK